MADIFILLKQYVAESKVSFVGTVAEVATIWGFVYALPNFIRQMNAANISAKAGEVLSLLPNLRQEIINLLCNSKKDEERDKIIKRLINLLSQIQGFLKLLPLPEVSVDVGKQLNVLIEHDDYTNNIKIEFLLYIFGDEWREVSKKSKSEIDVPFVNEMEKNLIEIYCRPLVSTMIFVLLKECIILGWCAISIYVIKAFFSDYEALFFIGLIMLGSLIFGILRIKNF